MIWKLIRIGTLLTALTIFLTACKEDSQDKNNAVLYEKFTAYINGEFWTEQGGKFNCFPLQTTYVKNPGSYGDNPGGFLAVVAKDCQNSNVMGLILDNIYSEGTYLFDSNDTSSVFLDRESRNLDTMEVFPTEHYSYHAVSGQLTIKEFRTVYYDTISPPQYAQNRPGWIEGTFEMVMVNDISKSPPGTIQDTLQIRDGKFAAIL
ncbi:hypothetical protein [Croceimicrobium hydrocarbonivorans]|uniref:Lipoprotein n=1 Tax=Croceimicrobium hydrocarbonivorans TaxID=2761580 RepID=A0A7H0VJ70_9FLAO|nr:hypothetical protein [Croceimicrobium hydrocarbonivorans]QNR25768.1 hypothetical protein H4K34_07970 [Croceimicrobium hydrocarbonivorans]